MDKTYQVEVTVRGATSPKGCKPVIGLTYFVRVCCPQVARVQAIEYARMTKAGHPRKYKNAVFFVSDENITLL